MHIKLKSLIIETSKHQSAMDYLKHLVDNSPYKGNVYYAGGVIRDLLMNVTPKDLDIVVINTNDPENAGINFAIWATKFMGNYKEDSNPVIYPKFFTSKFNLKGITYNGIDLSDVEIEAVAPRKEKYTIGSRKPDVEASDLESDSLRRDLTVNSMFKNVSTGKILDLTGKGMEDLKNKLARTPLNPDVTFSDDPLRMLRLVRQSIKYDWNIPFYILRSVKKNASKLQNISSERIRDELDKMLMTGSPERAIKLLKITGVLNYVIPEFKESYRMTQNAHHKHTVFKHSLEVLSKTQPVLLQRLMGLFHDIGKTTTRSVTPTGVHFYGHEKSSSDIVDGVMRRLKYPIEMIDAVKKGVSNHMRLKHGGDDAIKLSDKTLRKFKIEMGENLEDVLNLIHADNVAHAEASSMPNQINNVRKRLDQLNITVSKPKLPINGKDLIDMGIKPGPIFSKILDVVTDKWYENPDISREAALKVAKGIANDPNI